MTSALSTTTTLPCEYYLATAERTLSFVGVVPLLSTLTGILRVALGIIQTTGALLATIVLLPACAMPKGRVALQRALGHMVNGIANVLSGLIESIPLGGTLLFLIHYYHIKGRQRSWPADPIELISEQSWALLCGYRTLWNHPTRCCIHHSDYIPVDQQDMIRKQVIKEITEMRNNTFWSCSHAACWIHSSYKGEGGIDQPLDCRVVELRPWLIV